MSFPPGDNCSDALISGTHYNLTTLRHWNYTYYVANKTISNSSTCFLLFPPYMPHLLQNGTFLNSTSCYSPILPLGVRSKIGIGFSSLFLLSLILTLVNFKSHDPSFHLPTKKLHSARRWQCFWLLLTNTCALIAGLVGVDVDRYYLPELPLVLYNVFWFLAVIATMASVAESAWLWACWHESLDDLSTTILSRDEWWMKIRFPLRLLFYICLCVDFFMVMPRSWTDIENQRSVNQTESVAKPAATDIRFKIGALSLLLAWSTTACLFWSSVQHFTPVSPGPYKVVTFFKHAPRRLLFPLLLCTALIGYVATCAFHLSNSPLNVHFTSPGFMYILGWAPIAAIVLVIELPAVVQKLNLWPRLQSTLKDCGLNKEIARSVATHSRESVIKRSPSSRNGA